MTIKEARKKAGLTQAQLAKKIGVLQPNLARWESGKYDPKINVIKKIAEACECKIEELI